MIELARARRGYYVGIPKTAMKMEPRLVRNPFIEHLAKIHYYEVLEQWKYD